MKQQIINHNQGNKRKEREAKDDGGDSGENYHGNEKKYKSEQCFKVACNNGRHMAADHITVTHIIHLILHINFSPFKLHFRLYLHAAVL
jgi:hypothetical protein